MYTGLAFPKDIPLRINDTTKQVCSKGKSDDWAEQSHFKVSCVTLGKSQFLVKLNLELSTFDKSVRTLHYNSWLLWNYSWFYHFWINKILFHNMEMVNCHFQNQSLAVMLELNEDFVFNSVTNLITKPQFSITENANLVHMQPWIPFEL